MNKNLKFAAIALSAFVIGMGANNFAMSQYNGVVKVAVVDVQQVVSASSEVTALREENQAKTNELVSYIEQARKDVAATTDADKKKSLEEKYSKELNAKREVFGQEYNKKMMEIQKNILNAVREQAVGNGYDLVLSKDIVLYGGEDITEPLKKSVASVSVKGKAKKK